MESIQELLLNLEDNVLISCINSNKPKILNKRKNVDYQWSEYIVYHILKNLPFREEYSQIILSFDPEISKEYLNDLIRADKKKVMEYYSSFYEEVVGIIPEKVFLLGKNQNRYPEIQELHRNFKGNIKFNADIIFKTNNGEYIGISVKSSEHDTLTNYSIYLLLPKQDVVILKELLKELVLENNLKIDLEYYKNHRKDYNKLFINGSTINNDYHKLLNRLILINSTSIIEQWYSGLFGELPYNIYTFSGKKLLNKVPVLDRISIVSIQNPAKNPVGAAKLFFAVFEGDVVIYKWEIRWKGNIFVSPQILTFNWDPLKDIFRKMESNYLY